MKTSLGKFAKTMTYNIPHGDVRALLTRVMNMSRQNSVITARGIHLKVRTHFKTNQLAFGSWHQQLQDWYDTLTSLRQPVPFNEQVINYITLITDIRYKDEVRKDETRWCLGRDPNTVLLTGTCVETRRHAQQTRPTILH